MISDKNRNYFSLIGQKILMVIRKISGIFRQRSVKKRPNNESIRWSATDLAQVDREKKKTSFQMRTVKGLKSHTRFHIFFSWSWGAWLVQCIFGDLISRDGTGASESQIVRTPLRVFYDCMGKPDWIVFSLKSPIDFTVF